MLTRTLAGAAGLTVAAGLSAAAVALAAPQPQRLATHLTVLGQAKPQCHGTVCTIRNHGAGTMAGFGKVTFTTVITDDTGSSLCPKGSTVPRLVRTLKTGKGDLALNETGLVCPQPKIGPRVDLVWVADGARSTGVFAGAEGSGVDHAYLARNTAAQTGTITLAH